MRSLVGFALTQLNAALFGIAMLALIVGTFALYPAHAALPRYDFLFICAVLIQIAMIASGLETWPEARVILAFHIAGTVMELFKTSAGSWVYPEANFVRLMGVPLFSGFMYAAVGSYIARSWRLHDFKFERYPPFWLTLILGLLAYVNFFAHHFVWDMRWALTAATITIFARTWLDFSPVPTAAVRWRLPLLVPFVGLAGLIYVAENIATFGRAWVYPNQTDGWQTVSPTKFGSWFLLMLVSWALVSAVRRSTLANTRSNRNA
ncbi:MAG: DUF817 domain-containing protein [Pseudomonadota bacterium]